jgi:hypothetical protein
MSAFVAFNGFPGGDVQAPIQSLLVQERQTPVPVPAKQVKVGVLAAKRAPAASSSHRAAARRSQAPTATTGPVVHRTAPKAAPAPTSSPAPRTGSPTSAPVAQTTPVTSDPAPSVPDTTIPAPAITLPSVPPPPQGNSQLPVDTSGITGILTGG